MAKYSFLVFSNCTDSAREVESNRWYSHIHLPDLSAAKGFVTARRYVNAAECRPRRRHIDCIAAAS